LEQAGIATVVMGSARDIVETCGVPRFLFTDYPLGNPCGRPYDADGQDAIMGAALDLIEQADGPGTTVQTPLSWDACGAWKENFMHVGPDNLEALRAAGDARRAAQAAAKRSD
ncbi:MAG: glycine reductase, partial [Gammaproteobacteria bacterium]